MAIKKRYHQLKELNYLQIFDDLITFSENSYPSLKKTILNYNEEQEKIVFQRKKHSLLNYMRNLDMEKTLTRKPRFILMEIIN